jgi:hypothetical protein
MNFREGEEAVPVAAIFDERRLQRRFDANHLRQKNVTLEWPSTRHLVVEVGEFGTVDHNHPCLFGVAGVDEHAPCHGSLPRRSVPTGASDQRSYDLSGARGTVRRRPAERPDDRAKTGTLRAAGSEKRILPTSRFLNSHRLTDNPADFFL